MGHGAGGGGGDGTLLGCDPRVGGNCTLLGCDPRVGGKLATMCSCTRKRNDEPLV